jgi:uncharacterized membrane protein
MDLQARGSGFGSAEQPSSSPARDHAESANERTPNGAICYLWGVGFPLLYLPGARRNRNHYLRFHCFQSLILFSIWLAALFFEVPWLHPAIKAIWVLTGFIAWVVAAVMAGKRRMFHLPIIGDVAEWLEKL